MLFNDDDYTFTIGSIKRHIRPNLKSFLALNLLNENVYLGGGALRTIVDEKDSIVDFDLFYKDLRAKADTREHLEKLGAVLTYACPEGKLYSYNVITNNCLLFPTTVKVQLITERAYETPIELIDTFDINACRIAMYKDTVYLPKVAIHDIKKKLVTLNRVDYPVPTYRRMWKYKEKGYHLPSTTILDYIERIHKMGLDNVPFDGRFYID